MKNYVIKINKEYFKKPEWGDDLAFQYTPNLQKAAMWSDKDQAENYLRGILKYAAPNTIYGSAIVEVKQIWIEVE